MKRERETERERERERERGREKEREGKGGGRERERDRATRWGCGGVGFRVPGLGHVQFSVKQPSTFFGKIIYF